MIPIAIYAIETSELIKNGKIPSEFKSYISSFGAASMQSGLLAALAFYHSETEAGKKRKKVMNVIYKVLEKSNDDYKDTAYDNLFLYAKHNKEKLAEIKADIMNAAVAVKLAMRTFEFDKNN